MKRQRIDSQVERRLLAALISSTDFLSQAVPVLDISLIQASHFRFIATWCLEYFNTYQKAPKQNIESIFYAWAEDHEDSPDAQAIEDLLEDLSEDFEDEDPVNIPYLLDQLRGFLERRSLQHLQDTVDQALQVGRAEEARQAVLNYRPVEMLTSLGIDPLRDEGAWERCFSEAADPLIEFPGDAGRFLNHALVRDALIGIQGPEKRGKTFWCIEFVARALRNRRRVAFFQVGDLSELQVMQRLGMYFASRPFKKELCGEIRAPIKIIKPATDEDEVGVENSTRLFKHHLTEQACLRAVKRMKRSYGLNPDKSYLKVSVHANSSINVRGVMSVLDRWEMSEGFIPDVIIIDYADILAPEDPSHTTRDQVNETWKALRRLSQERHCLVIAPTQADAASYDLRTQSAKNFSEDKRKLAHVTGMLGLNQTPQEKTHNVMRLNWIVLRENPFNTFQCLWVGQCLAIGHAFYCGTL